MKTIQPLSNDLRPTPNLEQQVTAPTVVTPTEPAISDSMTAPNVTPPTVSAPNTPTMHVDGQPVAYSTNSQMLAEKRHIPWFRIAKWALLIIVIAGAGTVLATNQNIRATVLRQKFVSYNYPNCKTHICSVKFYRGSKIASYTPYTPAGDTPVKPSTDLISPIIDGKTYIAMKISAYKLTAASQQYFNNQYDNCSAPNETSGFTIAVPNFDTSANMCAITGNSTSGTVIGYTGVLTDQKEGALYDVIISENLTLNSQGQSSNVFDLSNHENEIQSIISSFAIKNR